jgi:hypothetical protein
MFTEYAVCCGFREEDYRSSRKVLASGWTEQWGPRLSSLAVVIVLFKGLEVSYKPQLSPSGLYTVS